MKFSMPKGMLVLLCLISASAFSMGNVEDGIARLSSIQANPKLSLVFRVKVADLVLQAAIDEVPASQPPRSEAQVFSAVRLLKQTILSKEEGDFVRNAAVDKLAEQYFSINGIDRLLSNLERELEGRTYGSAQVAAHLRKVIRTSEDLRGPIVKFGGPFIRYSLPDSIQN